VLRWWVLPAVLGLLAACGSRGSPLHPPAHAPSKASPASLADPAAKALAGMVDAVGPSRSQAPVDLKFAIRERPQVGQDDEIDYAVVPVVPGLEAIRLVFGSVSGLKVANQAPPLVAVKPASGVPIFGSVTVRPLQSGLYTLTAVVAVQSPGQSVVWPFWIPVIAGEGPAQTAANQP
ncbi:MAG: hypothetical protein ACRDL8_12350, partial [Solirubrobacteraceae bacterium]